jgi:hypothetical protein
LLENDNYTESLGEDSEDENPKEEAEGWESLDDHDDDSDDESECPPLLPHVAGQYYFGDLESDSDDQDKDSKEDYTHQHDMKKNQILSAGLTETAMMRNG